MLSHPVSKRLVHFFLCVRYAFLLSSHLLTSLSKPDRHLWSFLRIVRVEDRQVVDGRRTLEGGAEAAVLDQRVVAVVAALARGQMQKSHQEK